MVCVVIAGTFNSVGECITTEYDAKILVNALKSVILDTIVPVIDEKPPRFRMVSKFNM